LTIVELLLAQVRAEVENQDEQWSLTDFEILRASLIPLIKLIFLQSTKPAKALFLLTKTGLRPGACKWLFRQEKTAFTSRLRSLFARLG